MNNPTQIKEQLQAAYNLLNGGVVGQVVGPAHGSLLKDALEYIERLELRAESLAKLVSWLTSR